jgi:S-adenosylmethionine/arginine decarboxylase-like enzyme
VIRTHIIFEFYKADRDILATTGALKAAVDRAMASLNLSPRQDSYIQFEPEGVTATVVGEFFHFSIHTWPEFMSCAVDLYTAQDQFYGREIANALTIAFKAQEYDLKILTRTQK